ncbi:MAG: 6-pyruvoyl trahydropterin synthase family protein [Bdellovibrio sp.]
MTTLHLAKQNFKFSAAHFLIFDEQHAERLHGHNYQVRVDIKSSSEVDLHTKGYFLDFNVFKKYIKSRLDLWDEIVILPEKHPDMKFNKNGKCLEVNFRDRFYAFPLNEVVLLPVTNTSVEQLSKLLAEDFLREFKKYGVEEVTVSVEETQGQGASTVVRI